MKNNIKSFLMVMVLFGFKNVLSASNEEFFLLSEEFDFIAKKAHSFQEATKQPFEGKIYFRSPCGVLEFKYALDTMDKGSIYDTPVTQFSTNDEFWSDVLRYYISETDSLSQKKPSPLILRNIEVNNIDHTKKRNIYYPLRPKKIKFQPTVNKELRKPITILISKDNEQSIQKTVTEYVKKNENNNVRVEKIYPYFNSIEKSYRRDNVGMFKIFLSHENKIAPSTLQKFESFEKTFNIISKWVINDLKLKANKHDQESSKILYYL